MTEGRKQSHHIYICQSVEIAMFKVNEYDLKTEQSRLNVVASHFTGKHL